MKTSPKTPFFFQVQKLSTFWRASFVHVHGRKGKSSKTMNVMHHTVANALEGMLSYSIVLAFCVDGQKRFEYATCGLVFFENGEETPFQKYPETCGQGFKFMP